MITIVDYGMGNLGSIKNMFSRVGIEAEICSKSEEIARASKLVLPGVGAFDKAVERLRCLGLIEILNEKAFKERIPILGICLGMQLLSRSSEEGYLPGLGWLDAETVRFRFPKNVQGLRLPHMGWNRVRWRHETPALAASEFPEPRFYFVHSYHVRCNDPEDVLATTTYGIDFHSAVARGNIFGTQFHPEKSHKFGMRLLANFARL